LSAQATPVAPDTAAARAVVDSLVRIGAFRLPRPDTVRVAGDTARARSRVVDDSLRIGAFVVGLIVLAGLGVGTVQVGRRFLKAIDARASIGVQSQWGGFGGGDGGWEMSSALSLLSITLVLAVLTAVVATSVLSVGSRLSQSDAVRPPDAGAVSSAQAKK
jgi:hypothetical protein